MLELWNEEYAPQRHSAAKPQPKKNGYHHEAHEEHEGRKHFFSDSMSSALSGLRVLRDLRGEKVFCRMAHS